MAGSEMWTSFLSLLDPLRVYITGTRTDLSEPYAHVPDIALHEETLSWSRIKHLEFTNAAATSFLGYSFFLVMREMEGTSPLQVVYNIHQQWPDGPNGYPVDQLLLFDLSWLENGQPDEACPIFAFPFVEVLVRVRDEDEGFEILEDVEHGWNLIGTRDAEKRKWRRRLRIEVVEENDSEDEMFLESGEDE
ncbi:hypothetical protein BDY24DRAFT_398419 [Mrakia frigida]|uniref:uncharacterized protein n=1 Tax=Mrakia frigida TaxID=29902 RepID=UPI003FCBF515